MSVLESARARAAALWAVAAATSLLAVASVAVSGRRALSDAREFGSKDFQWSPTRLFLDGVDPYQARLDGSDDIILTQSPNYLHLLYEVLSPVGLLPFTTARAVWLVLSVALAIALGVFYARTAHLGRAGTVILVGALLASTPVRLGLSVGQHGVFLLACATVAFAFAARPWAGIPLAVALTKYSFAPLGLVLLVAGRIRTIVVAGAVLAGGALLFAVVTSTGLVDAVLGPFRVAGNAVGSGAADLMTVLGLTPWFDGNEPVVSALAVVGAVALAVIARRQIRSGDWVFQLGIASVVSLICFKHLAHDLVFLLPVVVLALRMTGARAAVAWAGLAWHGFVVGVLSQLGTPYDTPAVVVASFLVLAAMFAVLATDPDAERSRDARGLADAGLH
ncbi:glycosyltransferase family 87 protein [Blastococcus litoris]|uniref:glycosyltransferase family 87 protein n=1 Tax=Blastococcus litoris TaxID=2171622 RepID=UPI0013DF74EE|nr:glycosyltransferase family 87 protein [Blastococcus litoris]